MAFCLDSVILTWESICQTWLTPWCKMLGSSKALMEMNATPLLIASKNRLAMHVRMYWRSRAHRLQTKMLLPLSPFHSASWDPFFPAPWVKASGSITHLSLLENKTPSPTLSGKKQSYFAIRSRSNFCGKIKAYDTVSFPRKDLCLSMINLNISDFSFQLWYAWNISSFDRNQGLVGEQWAAKVQSQSKCSEAETWPDIAGFLGAPGWRLFSLLPPCLSLWAWTRCARNDFGIWGGAVKKEKSPFLRSFCSSEDAVCLQLASTQCQSV